MTVPDKLNASYLRRYGFAARTIIDVGVLSGTPWLYEVFPDARFILVDPLEESRASVTDLWGGLDFVFHQTALGARKGSIELEIEPSRPSRSTPGHRFAHGTLLERRKVDVVRLDTLTDGIAGPFGLKIDTEGHELEVIKGATRTLERCEFVIAEVSVKKRFEGGYRFSDFIAAMAERGFEVHSFLSGLTRAPRMSDVLFIPADSPRFDMTPKA